MVSPSREADAPREYTRRQPRETADNDVASCLRYVRTSDGRLVPLALQSFDNPNELPRTSTWLRLGKQPSMAMPLVKLSYWIGSPILDNGSNRRRNGAAAIGLVLLKLIVAWPIAWILVYDSQNIKLVQPNPAHGSQMGAVPNKRYDAVVVPHGDGSNGIVNRTTHQESPGAVARRAEDSFFERHDNTSDIRLSSDLRPQASQSDSGNSMMLFEPYDAGVASRPRYLCFIKDYDQGTYETMEVSKFIHQHGSHASTEFIFVSYTRMQFRVATDDEISNYDYQDEETREANREVAKRDRQMLIRWGIDAAKRAGKMAFWIDFECVRDTDGVARSTSMSDDVYRICDVVRTSHSMIIAVGPPASDKVSSIISGEEHPESESEDVTRWLRQWGSRLWTLPELLLCPGEHRIKLYVFGDTAEPVALAKRNFAERAWDDADAVGELVNHYEGSAILTQLQLIEAALACFARRKTDQFSPGDVAYAIMGLLPLRQRPKINEQDSGFQAFARLSLANDGGDFVERLICLLPPGEDVPWYNTKDVWGTKLSDVRPANRVAEVVEEDTLLLDGVYGTTIQWDGFDASIKACASESVVASTALLFGLTLSGPTSQLFLLAALLVEGIGRTFVPVKAPSYIHNMYTAFIIMVPLAFALVAPLLVLFTRCSGRGDPKAQLVGIEGHIDAAAVERHVWGFNHGRLTQIPGYHRFQGSDDEQQSGSLPDAESGYLFTLVDTHLMTVMHIHTRRPPVAMFVVGQEGGMQRAMLCSYEWKKNVFLRETVVRVGMKVLDRMDRVDRFRLCLNNLSENRDRTGAHRETPDVVECRAMEASVNDTTASTWKAELAFVAILLVSFVSTGFNITDGPEITLRIDGVYDRYRDPIHKSYNLLYAASFVVAQVFAYFLLRQVSNPRTLPLLLTLKGLIPIWPFTGRFLDLFNIVAIFEGSIDGMLLYLFIVIIWSWHGPKFVPIRILIFALFRPQVMPLLTAIYPMALYSPLGAYAVIMGHSLLCFCVAFFGFVGLPMEVSWLPAFKKVEISARASTSKYAVKADGERPQRKYSLFRDPQPFIFFGISLLTLLIADTPRRLTSIFYKLCPPVVTIGVGIILCKRPRLTVPIILLGIVLSMVGSALHLSPVASSPIVYFIMRLWKITSPLLWAVCVSSTDNWKGGLQALAFSLSGAIIGHVTKLHVPLVSDWRVSLPMVILDVVLVCLLWRYEEVARNKSIVRRVPLDV